MTATTAVHQTSFGRAAITVEDGGLRSLKLDPLADGEAPTGLAAEVASQLDAYLAGERTEFDLPLAPLGSPFEQSVWTALQEIPYGETVSYGELALRIGRPPGAARAVGRANGRNPLWIVVPCHRVIGANGALTGYAGGVDVKRELLALESDAVVGVSTTKIYCRPTCTPPRAPKPENTRRFATPASARAAGYRACKLCRPTG